MNLPVEKDNILCCHVGLLGASPEFVQKTKEMGFETLGQIIAPGWGALQRHEKFDYLWFNELVRIMEKKQILHLLEDH